MVRVEVKHKQLRLFGAVPTTDGADEFGARGSDPPHHPAAAARVERHQVTHELARFHVPQLDSAIVRGRHDKVVLKLETGDGALVFVGSGEGL